MKAEELVGKSKDELKKLLLDLKKQQFNLRFQLSQGQLENTAQIRQTRRDIARVITFLNKEDGKSGAPAPKSGKSQKTTKKTTTKKAAKKKAA